VLPDAEHGPPARREGRIDPTIAIGIALELWRPVLEVRRRDGPVLRTSVPVAAVDEHRQPTAREDDIRTHAKAVRKDR
jgi:hypothetical protein